MGVYLSVLVFLTDFVFHLGRCSSVRVIHYEQGGTCRAFSEISRRDLRTC